MMRKLCFASCLPVVVALVSAVPTSAQADKTASQFYTEYRAAFDKAKAVEDVLPFLSAPRRKQMESTSAADRKDMFELMKIMNTLTNVKITKEATTANGATLTVEALDSDKSKTTGIVTLVKENGAWKLDKESFTSSPKGR
jgi:hypothetical protein